MTLIARFTVEDARPTQLTGLEADWMGVLVFSKTLTSGITGHATTAFMSAGSEEGLRSYVATERITGHTDDGREGAFTVQHGGLESDPDTWFGHIVPKTGTGAFEGWSGPRGSSTMTTAPTSRSTCAAEPVNTTSTHRHGRRPTLTPPPAPIIRMTGTRPIVTVSFTETSGGDTDGPTRLLCHDHPCSHREVLECLPIRPSAPPP